MTTLIRRATAVAAALTVSALLAACGGGATPGSTGGSGADVEGPHNEADVTFAQGMLPHHRQAIEMSELAADRAEDPEVLTLTEEISAAQEPEIRTLTAFLEAWGADVPAEDMSMDGMDHGGDEAMDDMAGMMGPDDMTALESAQGAEFDEMFLQMMVEHHEGAVDMAETQVDEGENPGAVDLAETIIETQESEIQRMQDLLDS